MKRPERKPGKVVAIAAGVIVVFAAGLFLGGNKIFDTGKTTPKSSQQSNKEQGSTKTQKNKGADGVELETQEVPKEEGNNSQASSGTADKGNADNGNGQTQGGVAIEGGTAVYDESLPDDSPAIHRYEFILSDCTWTTAFQDCLDRGGYLVRINSELEYEYLRKEIVNQGMTNIFFRIGGKRDRNNQDYHWANQQGVLFGEKLNSDYSWCFDSWGQGEPSFKDGNLEETYMDLYFSDAEKRFIWNDVPNDMLDAEPAYAGALGYICEYE